MLDAHCRMRSTSSVHCVWEHTQSAAWRAAVLGSRRLHGAHPQIDQARAGVRAATGVRTSTTMVVYLLWERTNRTCVGRAIGHTHPCACACAVRRAAFGAHGYARGGGAVSGVRPAPRFIGRPGLPHAAGTRSSGHTPVSTQRTPLSTPSTPCEHSEHPLWVLRVPPASTQEYRTPLVRAAADPSLRTQMRSVLSQAFRALMQRSFPWLHSTVAPSPHKRRIRRTIDGPHYVPSASPGHGRDERQQPRPTMLCFTHCGHDSPTDHT